MSSLIDQAKSLFTTDPDNRLAKRQERKRLIAETELKARRLGEIDRELAVLNQRADAAADKHASICQPLQAELQSVEGRIIEALADGRTEAAADTTRRADILAQIASENSALQLSIAAIDKQREALNVQRVEVARFSSERQTLESELARAPLANPDWLIEFQALEPVIKMNDNAVDQVRRRVELFESDLARAKEQDPRGDYTDRERQVARWRESLRIVKEQHTSAANRRNELHRLMLSE